MFQKKKKMPKIVAPIFHCQQCIKDLLHIISPVANTAIKNNFTKLPLQLRDNEPD